MLFDQNAPRPLAAFLVDHQVYTTAEMGWPLLRNGELLHVAEEHGFEVMVTADKNLFYQQNLEGRKLAVVVLPSGQWPRVQLRLADVVRAVDVALPGTFTIVESDRDGT